MAEALKDKDDDFEIIEEGANDSAEELDEKVDKKVLPKEEDDRLRNNEEDDDEEDTAASDSESPEQRTERNREKRRKQRERQRKAEAAARAEIQTLRERDAVNARRIAMLEEQSLRNDATRVDAQLNDAKRRYQWAEEQHAQSIAKGDGIGANQALQERDRASRIFAEGEREKARIMAIAQQRGEPERQVPRGPDPEMQRRAVAFVKKHSWIDPAGKADEDSAIATTIDQRLHAEGYDPKTDEFWEELENRLASRLPHRFKEQSGRKGPPVAGGADRSASGKKTFLLSRERKQAMMDSGDWEDPVKRTAMIKNYAAYDAKNKSNRQ